MDSSANSAQYVHFGDFEFNVQARELRKQGVPVKLQGQPIEILAMLLERPGQLVSREELRKELWSGDTYVDFDHSLNAAVKRLRDALEDNADTPRYVETLARRGYRFIASVETSAVPGPVGAGAQGTRGAHPQLSWQRTGLLASITIALLVSISGAAWFHFAHSVTSSPAEIRSIVVLPLENLSNDPGQDYFADGITDTLTTDLGQIGALRVISRTSAMHFKSTRETLTQIASELDVDAVVEGSVVRSGDRIHINVKLIHEPTDRQLWTDSYDRDTGDLIRLEDQLALRIAHEVSARVNSAEETRLASNRPLNPRAYDAYLHGRYLWNERIPEASAEAVGYFEQALREDPNFALAYSGLADCYSVNWAGGWDLRRAEEYARKALALQPDLVQGHVSLALAEESEYKFGDGEKELKHALELNPNYAMAHHWYARHLLIFGRLTESLAENDRVRQLDPFSFTGNIMRGVILTGLRQYDRAIEAFEKSAAVNPQSPIPHDLLARIYWIERKVPGALAEERKSAALARSPERLHDQDEIAAVYARTAVAAFSRPRQVLSLLELPVLLSSATRKSDSMQKKYRFCPGCI